MTFKKTCVHCRGVAGARPSLCTCYTCRTPLWEQEIEHAAFVDTASPATNFDTSTSEQAQTTPFVQTDSQIFPRASQTNGESIFQPQPAYDPGRAIKTLPALCQSGALGRGVMFAGPAQLIHDQQNLTPAPSSPMVLHGPNVVEGQSLRREGADALSANQGHDGDAAVANVRSSANCPGGFSAIGARYTWTAAYDTQVLKTWNGS